MRKGFFIENKTTHRVLTCEVSELRYFNAWQPRIPAKSTCGGYAVELVLGSTLVNVRATLGHCGPLWWMCCVLWVALSYAGTTLVDVQK